MGTASKLLKLKEWLTLEDAARHLSLAFDEDVSPADILRLALDGRVQLSVYFVNGAQARRWVAVDHNDVVWRDVPGLVGGMVRLANRPVMQIEDGTLIQLLEESPGIEPGVWDLPLVGAERIDVENEYQQRVGGPECSLTCLDGAFVRSNREDDGRRTYYELVTFDDVGSDPESPAEWRKRLKDRRIYPSHLPDDSMLVLRTSALLTLEADSCEQRPQRESIPESNEPDRSHVSDALSLVNQAARRYWANADQSDPTTHPNNADVAAWLIGHGLSKSLAEKAASIIRPKWAHNGRKPDS